MYSDFLPSLWKEGDQLVIQSKLRELSELVRLLARHTLLFKLSMSYHISMQLSIIIVDVASQKYLYCIVNNLLSDTTSDCWLHLINDGVTVMGDTVSVQWQGTGPYEIFRCRINQLQPVQNRGQQQICKFSSIIYSNVKYMDTASTILGSS